MVASILSACNNLEHILLDGILCSAIIDWLIGSSNTAQKQSPRFQLTAGTLIQDTVAQLSGYIGQIREMGGARHPLPITHLYVDGLLQPLDIDALRELWPGLKYLAFNWYNAGYGDPPNDTLAKLSSAGMKQVVQVFDSYGDARALGSNLLWKRAKYPFVHVAWAPQNWEIQRSQKYYSKHRSTRVWVAEAIGGMPSIWEVALAHTETWEREVGRG
jgi:hypothetical protein